jgi:putative hemolysin
VAHRSYAVYCALAAETPAVVREIGRLREVAFRAVGEGTGRAADLDTFDRHFWHLFLWDEARHRIAGAYRLGPTDTIASGIGLRGLYTRTLFRFGRRLLRQMGPALDLGRSFVAPGYQKEFSALLLLWQGIGRFVARHPRYRRLFGAVSVSAAYGEASRDLIADVLSHPSLRSPLARFTTARRPYESRTGGGPSRLAGYPEAAHGLIADLEPDGKGVPVLLRQYLKLQARVLSLSVDPAFSHALDALVVVDLDELDEATLGRYLGADGARTFRAARPVSIR